MQHHSSSPPPLVACGSHSLNRSTQSSASRPRLPWLNRKSLRPALCSAISRRHSCIASAVSPALLAASCGGVGRKQGIAERVNGRSSRACAGRTTLEDRSAEELPRPSHLVAGRVQRCIDLRLGEGQPHAPPRPAVVGVAEEGAGRQRPVGGTGARPCLHGAAAQPVSGATSSPDADAQRVIALSRCRPLQGLLQLYGQLQAACAHVVERPASGRGKPW